MKPLEGRVALVTGGARGIGRETCLALAEWGADFIAADLRETDVQKTAQDGEALGVRTEAISLDVSDVEQIQEIVPRLWEKFGKIDILVNSAGIGPTTPIFELDEEHWDKVMDVNIKGTFFVSQAVAKLLVENKLPGSIVHLSSMAGETGGRTISVDYAVSKGGVLALTKTMARHLGPHGINVNCVTPGIIDTEMTKVWPADVRKKLIEAIPMHRFASPREVATVIRFLASDDASFVNGDAVKINGGQYL